MADRLVDRLPRVSVTFYGLDATRLVDHGRYGRHPTAVEVEALNLANANARALLNLLGFATTGDLDDLTGSVSLADARRAVIRARVLLDRAPDRCTRPTEVIASRARRREDGAVELHPAPRAILFGVDAEGLRDRLDRFERLVVILGERGATHVGWG